MRVQQTSAAEFTLEFETEEELRDEHRTNLSFNALKIAASVKIAVDTKLLVLLRGPWGGESFVGGKVVAMLPDGVAVMIDGNPDEILRSLLSRAGHSLAPAQESAPAGEEDSADKRQSDWDRIRGLPQMDKILLAVKADRTERAMLLRESDPRILLSLLRNPRLTVEEVSRLSRSSYLTYDIADVIMKAGQWMANRDVQLGLIHNPKTPPAFAMRILPMLPDIEIRNIARAGTNMALKQAALRKLQGKV